MRLHPITKFKDTDGSRRISVLGLEDAKWIFQRKSFIKLRKLIVVSTNVLKTLTAPQVDKLCLLTSSLGFVFVLVDEDVRKALLPEGNGRDVYPRVQVNGRAVCVARAPCVSVWLSAERRGAGETWMSPSWRQLSS